MNGALAKKIRQTMRRKWREFYDDIATLPFQVRLRIAWHIIRTHRKVKGK